MKRLLNKWIIALLLVAALSTTATAQTRIATVDLRKLFDKYWKTEQATAAVRDRATDLAKEGTSLRENLKKASEEYRKLLGDANDQAVSAAEREKRKQAAETKLKDIKETEETVVQFERQAAATIDEQKRRMRDNILGEIRTAVTAKAKSAGYGIVIDTAADSVNNTPVIVYNSNDADLTDAILAQLNAGAPLKPVAEKPASTNTTTKPK